MFRAGAAAPVQLQWKRLGTGEPTDPAWEVGVQPPAGRRLWKERRVGRRASSGCGVDLTLWADAWGDGELREGGSSRECIPPPCTPARGTALKSCGVCHRPDSTRMRIGKVELCFFFPPLSPSSLSRFSSLWFCNLIFFPPSENTRGKRIPERGREREREAVGQEGRGWVGGTRSLRSVSLSAGHRIVWKAAANSKAPPPPSRVRFGAAAAKRAPPAAAAVPSTARRPPALSPAPGARAPNEEVGSRAGHGPPELSNRRGSPRPSPAPRPRCPRFLSSFALQRRGREGD